MNKTMVYAYTGVVITMLFWGSAFNAMSYIIQHMPPLSAAAERFTLASLGLFIIFAATVNCVGMLCGRIYLSICLLEL